MVKESGKLDKVFRALADPTRRAMLGELCRRESSVSELAAPHRMSLAAASKHIKALEAAGLVERTIAGRVHRCRLVPAAMAEAHGWLSRYERFWDERLDALAAELEKNPDQ